MSWFSSMVSGAIPLASAAGGFALGGPVGAGLGFLGGNALVGNYWAGKNYDAQQDQYNYSRDLQQQLFGREDTSVARRALDLESVGLSKTLAAGSGAGAGSIVSTTAPQRDVPENDAGLVLGLLSMDKDFQMKDAQIANLIQQNSNLNTQEKLLNAQTKQAYAQARKTTIDSDRSSWDFNYMKNTGQADTMNPVIKKSRETYRYLFGNPDYSEYKK